MLAIFTNQFIHVHAGWIQKWQYRLSIKEKRINPIESMVFGFTFTSSISLKIFLMYNSYSPGTVLQSGQRELDRLPQIMHAKRTNLQFEDESTNMVFLTLCVLFRWERDTQREKEMLFENV